QELQAFGNVAGSFWLSLSRCMKVSHVFGVSNPRNIVTGTKRGRHMRLWWKHSKEIDATASRETVECLPKRVGKRRVWVKPWINRRQNLGASSVLLKELSCEDPSAYRNHLRMSKKMFETLLEMVNSDLTKQDTNMRQALPAKLKLEVTLRYLATGDSFSSLMYLYRVSKSTICQFIPSVCAAICEALKPFIRLDLFV
ncbi:hypothetical protein NQ318_001342, partial [Aromia moschata]